MKKRIGVLILTVILMAGWPGCTAPTENSEAVSGDISFSFGQEAGEPESGGEESSSGVSSAPEATESSRISEVSGNESRIEEPQGSLSYIQEISPLIQKKGRIASEESQELLFVDEASDMPEQVPVYKDPYPNDHGEPEYEFTDEVKEIRRRNLTDFLDTLYGGQEAREYEISEDGPHYLVSWHTDTLDAWGREYGVHIYTKEFDIRRDAESGDLLSNDLILAALEYTGIKQPQVRRTAEYKGGGKAAGNIYTITEQSESVLENMQSNRFRHISVSFDAKDKKNGDTVRIVIEKNEPQEAESCETVSYKDALSYIQQKYSDKEVTKIRAEARYERTAAKGYFVPCYKFYVEFQDEANGKKEQNTEYDVTYLLMAKGWDTETLRKADEDMAG